jgi:hypothetical protein
LAVGYARKVNSFISTFLPELLRFATKESTISPLSPEVGSILCLVISIDLRSRRGGIDRPKMSVRSKICMAWQNCTMAILGSGIMVEIYFAHMTISTEIGILRHMLLSWKDKNEIIQ